MQPKIRFARNLRSAMVEREPIDPHMDPRQVNRQPSKPSRDKAKPEPEPVVQYPFTRSDVIIVLQLIENFTFERACSAVDKAVEELIAAAVPGHNPTVIIKGSGSAYAHEYKIQRCQVWPPMYRLVFNAYKITGTRSEKVKADLEELGVEVI